MVGYSYIFYNELQFPYTSDITSPVSFTFLDPFYTFLDPVQQFRCWDNILWPITLWTETYIQIIQLL